MHGPASRRRSGRRNSWHSRICTCAGPPAVSDTPTVALTAEEVHDRLVGPLVGAVLLPLTEAGGSGADVLALLEAVAAGVLAITASPDRDAEVLSTFGSNVAKRLALFRLGAAEPQGSA